MGFYQCHQFKTLALNVPRRRHLIDNPKHTLAVKPTTISKLKLFIRYFPGLADQRKLMFLSLWPKCLQIVPVLPSSCYRIDTISTHLSLWQWQVHQWQIPLHDRSWIINCFLKVAHCSCLTSFRTIIWSYFSSWKLALGCKIRCKLPKYTQQPR